jgi:8-oxo-dGTP pyrophosphatase MutT (NUDIX family)
MTAIRYDVDPVPDRTQLQRWLLAHRPNDADEHGHRDRMLELLQARGDVFARRHFTPGHFTASGFVVAPAGDALLLVRHPKLGRWLQPGGHVENGDADLLEAARRELLEEVGLRDLPLARDGIFDLDIHLIPARGAEPAHEHFDVRFLFRGASLQLPARDEAAEVRWFPRAELAAGAGDQSVLRALRKLDGA